MTFNSLLLTGEQTAHLAEIDRTAGERVNRTRQRDGGGAGRGRSAEGTRPDGVGRRDEQPESAGRGNRTERKKWLVYA